ncbi:MAG: methyltransferase domain-containing protein [Thiomargarita sp.]|nr:methyltransferase domain-containing protein [Thiomargarita sp.]
MSHYSIHRRAGYDLLTGHGLEIGACHQPAIIPAHCTIEYCDAQSKEEIIQHFPELNIDALVEVNYICDLDKVGLSLFEAERFDFVIFNHVIEHVANPIKVVSELFRITKPGGHVVISAPDKNFTFDRHRPLTSFAHLKEEYENNVTVVTEEHYIDFLRAVHPEVFKLNPEQLQDYINSVRNRREHAHVWDSQSFNEFMLNALTLLQIKTTRLFINVGENNQFEYFSVWQKLMASINPVYKNDSHFVHRKNGYSLLIGNGLEIGACFHQVAAIPWHCSMEYNDLWLKPESIVYSPELNVNDRAKVKHICDLDKGGLSLFDSESFDFVIFNHLIGHVADPIKVIKELFRITQPEGYVVISVPDKDFIFDKDLEDLEVTPFAYFLEKYEKKVTEVSATDDMSVRREKNRYGHFHIWDSSSFNELMLKSLERLQLQATCVFTSVGKNNQLEYFSVWKA